MKRITIVGLSLVAVFAFSAMASSSAFAGEYGVCVKAAKEGKKYTGNYTEKNCVTKSGTKEGKYEWSPYPGPAGTKWTFTSKGGSATLSTAQGSITCKKNTDSGEITGAKTDVDTVTFVECTNSVFGTNCYNVESTKEGKKGGTIIVKTDTKLIDHGEKGESKDEPAPNEVWTEFLPNGELGPYIASFDCKTPLGEDPFGVTGDASGVMSLDVNVMSTKADVSLGAGKGEQDLISNTASDEPPYEEVHLASTQTNVDDIKQAKVEINTLEG
jgi:hypothetical protein